MEPKVDVLDGDAPEDLVREWREFVDECTAGYPWNLYDYHNDLAVRDRLEDCLRAGCLPEGVVRDVLKLDARFREMLQPGIAVGPATDPWWHRGVPQYAGPELAEGIQEWFSAPVEVRD